jgi:hypothetical protein
MNAAFDEVYAPSINYRDSSSFNKLLSDIKKLQPDLIVGSSMGGYVSYIIGSKLSIPTLLFNPAMVGRSFDPTVDMSSMKGTSNTIYFGKSDTVIDGKAVKDYFNNEGVGRFTYNSYSGEHRVPENIFINAIRKITKVTEIYNSTKINNTMKKIKLFEEFVEEKKKGLWANVHAKRARGEKPAKPGDEDYPDEDAWKAAQESVNNELPDFLQMQADSVGMTRAEWIAHYGTSEIGSGIDE